MPSHSYGKVYIALTLGINRAEAAGARPGLSPAAAYANGHHQDGQQGPNRRQRDAKA